MPRIHVLHRPETPLHVILRGGSQKGKKIWCTLSWDWRTDAIEVGQWMGGRLYPHECDLSSDGVWMFYSALNAKWDDPTNGCFMALSRAPYLKAVGLYPSDSGRWGTGGTLIQRASHPPQEVPVDGLGEPLPEAFYNNFRLAFGYYDARLLRDGWSHIDSTQGPAEHQETHTFSRPIQGTARLERIHHIEPSGIRPARYDTHALVDTGGDRHPKPEWQWAQVDPPRNRLLWAEGGRLWAGRIGRRGLPEDEKVLYDLNGMRFQRRMAPY